MTKHKTVRPVGAPKRIPGAKQAMFYLDEHSIELARKIGKGNASEGVRKALKNYIGDDSHLSLAIGIV